MQMAFLFAINPWRITTAICKMNRKWPKKNLHWKNAGFFDIAVDVLSVPRTWWRWRQGRWWWQRYRNLRRRCSVIAMRSVMTGVSTGSCRIAPVMVPHMVCSAVRNIMRSCMLFIMSPMSALCLAVALNKQERCQYNACKKQIPEEPPLIIILFRFHNHKFYISKLNHIVGCAITELI
jgi:hypothetical protein